MNLIKSSSEKVYLYYSSTVNLRFKNSRIFHYETDMIKRLGVDMVLAVKGRVHSILNCFDGCRGKDGNIVIDALSNRVLLLYFLEDTSHQDSSK